MKRQSTKKAVELFHKVIAKTVANYKLISYHCNRPIYC